jgi:hypothetical protein
MNVVEQFRKVGNAAEAQRFLKDLTASVGAYGGRSLCKLGNANAGIMTFNDIFRHIQSNQKLATIEVLTEIERLECSISKTTWLQDFGTFWRRLPDRISDLFRAIFFMTSLNKETIRNQLNEVAFKRRVQETLKNPDSKHKFFDILFFGHRVERDDNDADKKSLGEIYYYLKQRVRESCSFEMLDDKMLTVLRTLKADESAPGDGIALKLAASRVTPAHSNADPRILFQIASVIFNGDDNKDCNRADLGFKFLKEASRLGYGQATILLVEFYRTDMGSIKYTEAQKKDLIIQNLKLAAAQGDFDGVIKEINNFDKDMVEIFLKDLDFCQNVLKNAFAVDQEQWKDGKDIIEHLIQLSIDQDWSIEPETIKKLSSLDCGIFRGCFHADFGLKLADKSINPKYDERKKAYYKTQALFFLNKALDHHRMQEQQKVNVEARLTLLKS